MKVTLSLRESVEENAQRYFEAAKKARRKAKGAEQAIALFRARASEKQEEAPLKAEKKIARKKEWFEKFRWCRSSDGILMVGGRDASTNELLVKRHTEPHDIVFHTDMAGSPFIIVKTEGREVPERTMDEAAQFCASFSRAWKNGLSALEVFHVAPSQVSKEPNPGEFLPKGAFVIRGKTLYHKPLIKAAVGALADGRIMGGPPSAVLTHCAGAYEVIQGNEKTSDVAKALAKHLKADLDDVLSALPPGGCRLGKRLEKKSMPPGETHA